MNRLPAKITLLLQFTLLLSACQSIAQKIWSPEMEIRTYHGGGMRPQSDEIFIRGSKGYYIRWDMPVRDTFYFNLSKEELDQVAEKINETNFMGIESGRTRGVIYDKATTTITFIQKQQTHKVSVGATSLIISGNPYQFYSLYNYILDLAKKKTKS